MDMKLAINLTHDCYYLLRCFCIYKRYHLIAEKKQIIIKRENRECLTMENK